MASLCDNTRGGTARAFVDGVLRSSHSATTDLSSHGTIYLGGKYQTGEFTTGVIAGVRYTVGSIPSDYSTSSTSAGTTVFTPTNLTTTSNGVTTSDIQLLTAQPSSSNTDSTVGTISVTDGGASITTAIVNDNGHTVDSLIDTPTNYEASSGNNGGCYCTMNPLKSRLTLSNGNLDSTSPTGWKGAAGTIGMSSGKFYWEIDNVVGNEHVVGIVKYNTDNVTWNTTYGYGAEVGVKYLATGGVSYGAAWTTGDVIGVAFDADNGILEFYKNGVSQGVAATGLTDGPYLPSMVHNGTSRSASINFGQRPWKYTPKADHVALCTQNLDDPLIEDPSTAFDTVLYNGDGQSTQTVSGLSFNPDLIWNKNRNTSHHHRVFD